MRKLAGRMTYLGFGMFAGIAITVATSKYLGGITQSDNAFQVLIATVTACTGALSAFAAYSVYNIAKVTHSRDLQVSKSRIESTNKLIKSTHDGFEAAISTYNGGTITVDDIHTYRAIDELIGKALDEPLDQEIYIAYWSVRAALRAMCDKHDKNGHLKKDEFDRFLIRLNKCLSKVKTN
tara:strand:- start:5603 stop:6142 length:540 start_codon:yes stop_codon:yes gene_type:complete